MHPYREWPVVPPADIADEGTHLAFIVLTVTGLVAMVLLPFTKSGAFGALCGVAGVDWLVRHVRR